ncbi:MAG TPA: Ig-like domain-containing protein [Candidatus Aphodovivens avistercoris]|nr:Ig-like domain-containing protein [Candidatus Aphodovivens avistercoris]
MAEDIGFAQNYTNLYFIDTTPSGSARTWARIGAGINNVAPAGNEVVTQDPYYDGEGVAESDVTGGQPVFSFSGHRKFGDPAQDYIASLFINYGPSRRTNFKWVIPNGGTFEGKCSVVNVQPQGGDPNAKGDFNFEVHMNGMPSFSPGDKTTHPDEIAASAVTVQAGSTSAINASVTPETASDSLVYAVDNDEIATVDPLGNVTGAKAGTCKVSVKSAVKPTVQATVEVTVSAGAAMSAARAEK